MTDHQATAPPTRPRLTLADIMTTAVTTLGRDCRIVDALDLLAAQDYHHLVVADGRRPVGVLTDRLLLHAVARGAGETSTVGAVMLPPLLAPPDLPLRDAVAIVAFHRTDCVLVVDAAGELCGIVTTTDLLGALYEILPGRSAPRAA
jgi:CBS domain-containing protein